MILRDIVVVPLKRRVAEAAFRLRARRRRRRTGKSQEDVVDLRRVSWWNWVFLACVSVTTTLGLAISIPPLLSEQPVDVWPWPKTHFALVASQSLFMLAFVTYLTLRQRRIEGMRTLLERRQLESKERALLQYNRSLELLDVSRILGTEVTSQKLLDRITERCVEVFSCHQASLMLSDNETLELEVKSATGHPNLAEVMGARQKIGAGIAGWVAEHRVPLLIVPNPHKKRKPDLVLRDPTIKAAMVVPVMARDDLVGVLNVSTRSPESQYDNEDLRALRAFAENAGTCIRYATDAEWMRQTNEVLQQVLEQRTSDTAETPDSTKTS